MNLTQIRHFLALARTLSFTRPAEACNVTQPALTKSIQRLEDELGGPLLLRERSLTQLTALGQAMLPLLQKTHAAAEGLHRRPLAQRAAHDVLLVAVAGRPFTRATDAFIKLARAREWQPSGTA